MNFYSLHIIFRALLLFVSFVTLSVSICLIPYVFQKKQLTSKIILLFCCFTCFAMVVLYASDMKSSKKGWQRTLISEMFCNQPVLISVVIVILTIAFLVFVWIKELYFRKNTLTRSSVKESLDKLTTGLCFSYKNGMVILVNHRMNELCHTIVGRDLQNASLFWSILKDGDIQLNVERLSTGSQPSFRLPNGTIWTFTREKLNGVVQLAAADTTQIYEITEELKERNIKLAMLNLRLKKYGENVDELTRSKERLEIKARIHSELGQALLATRRYFIDDNKMHDAPLDIWKRCIAMLHKEAQTKSDENPIEMLSRVALATGITLEIDGAMPIHRNINKLFVEAAAEALTNAVKHAEAKTLEIILTETDDTYTVCLANTGHIPKGEITEGGGLSSLRRKVEEFDGIMTVICKPKYMLIITVAKGKGDIE